MMENLRSAANHTALKIVLVIVVVAFTLSGVGGYLISGHSDNVAKVNGDEISRVSYESALASRRQQLQQEHGDNFSQLAANEDYMQQLRQQVLQQLIDQILLEQYAKTLSLDVSDEQIKQAIFQTPSFQTDDKFDNARYNERIKNMGMTPVQYAQAMRKQLINQQLISSLINTEFMLDDETDQLAALLDQRRVVREATINVSTLEKQQQVSDAEINTYYQQHKNQFVSPEQYRIDYIGLDATNINSTVTAQQAEEYYQQHQNEFIAPQQVRYSVIQTKTQADAQVILDQLKKGADFAQLAEHSSIDVVSAKKGGDIGWLTDSTMPEELKTSGLSEKGQLSGVIKSSVGYLVVRLDDIKPAQQESFAEVQQRIMDKLKQQKDLDAWYAMQQKVGDAASNDNDSLQDAAQVAGLKIQQTDWFSRNNIPKDLDYKPLQDVIFGGSLLDDNGKPNGNSNIITTEGDRAFVLRIADHKAQSVQPLSAVGEQVTRALKQQKAQDQARQQADKLLAQLKAGKGDAALQAAGLTFAKAQTISRNTYDPLTQIIFRLAPPVTGKISYGIGQDAENNIVLLALDSVQKGDMTAEQKTSLAQIMQQNNAQLMLDALITSLRSTASIKINQSNEH